MSELITHEEMADLLRISISTARHWRATSYGPPTQRLGRRVYARRSDVTRWLDTQFDSSPSS